MKLKIAITIIIAILFTASIVFFHANNSFNSIIDKETKNDIRIGYVNLHAAQISIKDLQIISKFNCDIWLFSEWNANNLNLDPSFIDNYEKLIEIPDAKTYGFLVLGKKTLDMTAAKRKPGKKKYTCNYPSIIIENEAINISFVHVPPPVPSCDFQTTSYITDLIDLLENKSLETNQILIGDFNLLPFQKGYKTITNVGFIDAFMNDFMLNGTFGGFKGWPKLLRIDYVFYRGNLTISYAERFELSSSDHCGLLTDIHLTE